jgi:glycosyltransferase involved in cell wall biosynthesis
VSKLGLALIKKGHTVEADPSKIYDVALHIGHVNKEIRAGRHIKRVDGVHFNASDNSHRKNGGIKESVEKSDGVVFQSNFSMSHYSKLVGSLNNSISTVIHNGTFLDIDSDLSILKDSRYYFFSASKWRPIKRLNCMLDCYLESDIGDSKFFVAGDISQYRLAKRYRRECPKNIIFLNQIGHEMLYAYLRVADAFVHLSYLDSCSNSIVEAMSKKVPILCNNNGGSPEIVKACNAGIICECDKEYKFNMVNFSKLEEGVNKKTVIQSMREILSFDREKIDNKTIGIDYVADQYLIFFNRIMDKK